MITKSDFIFIALLAIFAFVKIIRGTTTTIAEKEKSGWIPVSERLPEEKGAVCMKNEINNEAEVIDMCEWESAEDFKTSPFFTSCGEFHWRQDEASDFIFCPYCGKRLKEVSRDE